MASETADAAKSNAATEGKRKPSKMKRDEYEEDIPYYLKKIKVNNRPDRSPSPEELEPLVAQIVINEPPEFPEFLPRQLEDEEGGSPPPPPSTPLLYDASCESSSSPSPTDLSDAVTEAMGAAAVVERNPSRVFVWRHELTTHEKEIVDDLAKMTLCEPVAKYPLVRSPKIMVINMEMVEEWLVNTLTSVPTPFLAMTDYLGGKWRPQPKLKDDCRALLILVTEHMCMVPANQLVINLFPACFTDREPTSSVEELRGWRNLIYGSDMEYCKRLREQPGSFMRLNKWARKVITMMSFGADAHAQNGQIRQAGYILGYWICKLYLDAAGIPEDDLPWELVQMKAHFCQEFGRIYNTAEICPLPWQI